MNLQKFKRLNLRQPKYIFPLVIFLPLLGLIYFGMETFKGNGKTTGNVVTDSINMSIPDARAEGMDNKMTAMNKHFAEDGAFTAVDGIGDEYEQKDTTGSGYNDEERQRIDAVNAERLRQLKAEEDLRERQRANMNRINSYGRGGYGSSQQEDLNAYARELDRIQNRSMERQRQYQAEQDRRDKEEEAEDRRQRQEMIDALTGNTKKKNKKEEKTGIVACGIGYNYVKEALAQLPEERRALYNIEKVSQYPLPQPRIEMLAKESGRLLVVEDGQPVVEELVKGMLGAGYNVCGRLTGTLPRTGELTPDCVAAALGVEAPEILPQAKNLAARPPQLCQGCGHRDVYAALNKVAEEYPDHRIFGDIGCYTLGALPPFKALSSCVDMGASITMAKGAADAGLFPAIAVIGDSTFTHSGMTGLLDAVNDKSNITVIISDNLTTGMTGGQDSAGTNKFEAICIGLGVEPEHVRVVVPLPKNMEEITRTIREEIEYNGVSVIIPRRECIQTAARHARERKAKG